jgi:hypothetical protein
MLTRISKTIICLLLVALVRPAAAGPSERDVWYAFVDGDLRFGSHHVEVTRLPDGNFRYATATRLLLDLFGAQRQEIVVRGDFVVSPDLRPISIRSETEQMSGSALTTGWLRGNELRLTHTREGAESSSTYVFGESERVILDACFDEWLAALPPHATEATVKVIQQEGWKVGDVTATRTQKASTWEVTTAGTVRSATVTLDEDGVMLEQVHHAPKMNLRRCTADEAADIDYRIWGGRELLTFPLDREISAPHRLTSLTVRLAWRDIPLEEFELEDNRQKLVAHLEQSGAFGATVELSTDRTISESVPYPIAGEAFEPYLAETDFIKPADPGIVQAAREVLRGDETALEAVTTLCAWVNDHVESTLIAETLSGPEVLARKVGKCSEFSTLFASLARSAGIPTRIVLGERLVGSLWMGHMWNEAYVGEWILVDASANEVGRSCALLKFVHSDSVNGTQPLRWKVAESLEISVVDFELQPTDLSASYQTGVDGDVYTNVDFACRLTSPVETWRIEELSRSGHVTVRFRVPDADEVQIHFVAFGLPAGTEPAAITAARLNAFKGAYAGLEVHEDRPCEVNGAKGHTTRFGGAATNDSDQRYMTTEVVWVGESVGYLLNLIVPEALHERYLSDFQELLASFEALE